MPYGYNSVNSCCWSLNVKAKELQQQREIKVQILDPGGLFKEYELHKVNPVSCEMKDMGVLSLTTGSRSL